MQEIVPGLAEINMGIDNILRIKFAPKSNIDGEAAKKIVDASSRVSGNKKHCNLVNTQDMLFMNNDARKYFAQQEKSTVIAIAAVINSKFQKSIANLYLKFSLPKIPTKIFDDEVEAVRWLKSKM